MPTILFLGRSSVFGFGLPDPDRAWPCLIGEGLERRTGRPITVERRRLNMTGDPTDYLQRVFDETQPDVVNISVSAYDYASLHVQRRLDELAGKSIGELARKIEKATLPRDKTKKPGFIHRSIRKVGRKFVGTAPQLTRQQVELTLDRTFRFLARQEDIVVVVRSSAVPARALVEGNPKYAEAARQFSAEWRRKAEERHFMWVDTNSDGAENDHRQSDGIHTTQEGHEVRAAEIEGAFFDALCILFPELREGARATVTA